MRINVQYTRDPEQFYEIQTALGSLVFRYKRLRPVEFHRQRFLGQAGLFARVRRHINWNNLRPDLKEDLAHLVQDIRRRVCGIAIAVSPSF